MAILPILASPVLPKVPRFPRPRTTRALAAFVLVGSALLLQGCTPRPPGTLTYTIHAMPSADGTCYEFLCSGGTAAQNQAACEQLKACTLEQDGLDCLSARAAAQAVLR